MEESLLIQQLKNDDKFAYTVLYNNYWAKVYNFTRLYIMSDIESEDIVQEVFIKLWENRKLVDDKLNFSGFLFIITRNLIFNESHKKLNKSFYKLTVLDAIADESQIVSDKIVYADLLSHIKTIIERLPPRQQEVFKLSREQHLSYKEIAIQLEITTKTVERHINEALKYLKKHIDIT